MWHTRRLAKVLARLASVATSLDQHSVLASGRQQSQLIEGDHLTAGLKDASACRLGDLQCTDAQFGRLQETVVVCHVANNDGNGGLILGLDLHETDHLLQGDDRFVDAAHEQAAQNDLVELLVATAVQEAVELKGQKRFELVKSPVVRQGLGCKEISAYLDQESQIYVQRLGSRATDFTVPLVADVDTLKRTSNSK